MKIETILTLAANQGVRIAGSARWIIGDRPRRAISWTKYSKGWHRRHGPARWLNPACRVEGGELVLRGPRGTKRVPLERHEWAPGCITYAAGRAQANEVLGVPTAHADAPLTRALWGNMHPDERAAFAAAAGPDLLPHLRRIGFAHHFRSARRAGAKLLRAWRAEWSNNQRAHRAIARARARWAPLATWDQRAAEAHWLVTDAVTSARTRFNSLLLAPIRTVREDGAVIGAKTLVWDGDVLRSPQQGTAWHRPSLTAYAWSDSPDLRGVAGIHAMWPTLCGRIHPDLTVGCARRYLTCVRLVAEIVGWGRTVQGDLGWRAEHARITRIHAPAHLVPAIRARYPEVEVVSAEVTVG